MKCNANYNYIEENLGLMVLGNVISKNSLKVRTINKNVLTINPKY